MPGPLCVRYREAMEFVFQWVSTYGYGALFVLLMLGIVGLPIPDETLLVFCGYLISRGTLNPEATLLTAVLGSWCGISLSYWIGRTLGLGVVHRFGRVLHVNQERLDRVHQWFDHSGHWALFGGYYIAGVRHLTAIIAGASKLGFGTFILFAWSGGVCWAAAFLTLGYFIGEDWRRIADLVHRDLLYGSIVVIAVVLLYLIVLRPRAVPGKPR
jgi:membrane protein DedA with SNARE-associated domain